MTETESKDSKTDSRGRIDNNDFVNVPFFNLSLQRS